MFKNMHPTPTAGRKLRSQDLSGPGLVNRGDESRRVSCKQCGFSGCDTARDIPHVSEGYDNTPTEIETTDGNTLTVPSKRPGCPMCGSSEYL